MHARRLGVSAGRPGQPPLPSFDRTSGRGFRQRLRYRASPSPDSLGTRAADSANVASSFSQGRPPRSRLLFDDRREVGGRRQHRPCHGRVARVLPAAACIRYSARVRRSTVSNRLFSTSMNRSLPSRCITTPDQPCDSSRVVAYLAGYDGRHTHGCRTRGPFTHRRNREFAKTARPPRLRCPEAATNQPRLRSKDTLRMNLSIPEAARRLL